MRSRALIAATLLMTAAAAILPAQDIEALGAALQAGRAKFESFDFPASIQLLDTVIAPLSGKRETTVLSDEERTLLTQALELRGLAYFNSADEAAAGRDFDLLLTINPDYTLSPDFSSPLIQEFFGNTRKRIIGAVTVRTEPPGAIISIAGRVIGTSNFENHPIREGTYTVRAELPSHAPAETSVTIYPGRATDAVLTLERTHASLTLRTSPADVEIYLDGVLIGKSEGTAGPDYAEVAASAGVPLEAISGEFRISTLELGHHVLEFRKDCYEYQRQAMAEIRSANDYNLPTPIVLKESVGSLTLTGVPASARVLLNGDERSRGESRFDRLCAGQYRVEVIAAAGRFGSTVEIKSGDAKEMAVTLSPALVFLRPAYGALMDENERQAAGRVLSDVFTGSNLFESITPADDFYDRIPAEMRETWLSLGTLKPQGDFGRLTPEQHAVVRYLCREFSAGTAAIAAFHDRKLGVRVRVLFFSAEIPFYETAIVNIDEPRDIQRFRALLHTGIQFSRPWLGITAVDTRIHQGTVVLAVQPGSPAAAGTLEAGMTIAGIDGTPVASNRDLITGLRAKNPGDTVKFDIVKGGASSAVEIALGTSPQLLSLDNAPILYLPAIAAMQLIAESPADADRQSQALFNIGIAMGHFGAWEDAIRYLRRVQLGSQPGINQGTVHYFIGLGFEVLGFRAEAIDQFQQALGFDGATLDHNDGPLLAPQARQRLMRLQSAP